ncbi:MAG: PilZ domain-containing protein [Candidatus Omnitrophica bacterium]|nr:PilZ domain-containing protein [Candidatus Omnitrophota bacterium]
MPIRLREVDSVSILDIDGRIDINSSDLIEMVGWLVNSGKVNVILNLENTDTVDYNGLSILTIAYKNVTNHKGKLKLINVPLSVIELLKAVKLETVFEIYTEEDAAVSSFFDEGIDKLSLRRRFQRLEIHLNVKYKMISDQKKPKLFDGRVLNLSAAGIYVYTPYTFPINSMLDLEFNVPGMAKSLETTGKVSWLADKEIQPHAYPGMGVSFVHLTPEKEKAIADFIEKNITHRADSL